VKGFKNAQKDSVLSGEDFVVTSTYELSATATGKDMPAARLVLVSDQGWLPMISTCFRINTRMGNKQEKRCDEILRSDQLEV